MLRKLVSFFMYPLLWKMIAVICLLLVIWFLGPLFAFAGWRPLESSGHRIALVLLVLGYCLVKKIISLWRVRRLNEKFIQAFTQKNARIDKNCSAIDELGKKFILAMQHLKNATANNRNGFLSGLNRRFVYQFPWYVFIGAPGSGKTTALINSGLQFPLTDVMGREPLKGVGGTRNCDWWITDDAVFIDTAGRYITHEGNALGDKEEWAGFLELLKKFRPKQPLNGAVLTISIADLLTGSEQVREKHAAIIRTRLGELGKTLGINFPVYILITKTDLLGGFNTYFSNFTKEEREQVLGFTFSEQPEKVGSLVELVNQELQLITRRLFDGLPDLLLHETDVARRAYAFSFPQNFSNCLTLIGDLVEKIFTSSQVSSAQIRGVYFTSGTQEGTPFDRALSSLGRRFGVSSNIVGTKNSAAGRSYFLKDLVSKVVIPEAHLAGKNRAEEKRELWLGLGSHTIIFLLFFVFSGFIVDSYYKNSTYLATVENKNNVVANTLDVLAKADSGELIHFLPVLNSLCCLANGDNFSVENPPLKMTLGLYQGEKMDAATQLTYRRALQSTLLPLVARRSQELLSSATDHNIDFAYQALKVYLMLNQPEHYNYERILQFVETDFRENLIMDFSREQQASILFHLRNLFSVEAQISPFILDEALVQEKRRLVSGFSFSDRAYQSIKAKLFFNNKLPDVSFLSSGGAKSNFVFERISGKPLNDGISGLFTRQGYHQVFLPAVKSQLTEIVAEESWVLDVYSTLSPNSVTTARTDDMEQMLIRLYLQDYVSIWDKYLQDLRLISARSMAESIDVARILSAADSPLIQLINNVAPELSLDKDLSVVPQQLTKSFEGRFNEKVSNFDKSIHGLAAGIAKSDALEPIVDSRFKDLVELAYGANKDAEKNTLLKMFNEVYLNLSNADFSIRGGARTLDDNNIAKIRSEAARYPSPVRNILEGLTDEGKRQAEGGIRGVLNTELDSSIGEFCRMAINGRYPFDRGSKRDVTFADFSRLFSEGGMMESFFNENLREITDTTGRRWVLRRTTDVDLPIASFQQAARIRDVFFPAGARAPALNFEYKVLEMDARISQLSMDFDGQLFQYAHGPQIPRSVSWPSSLGSNQIRIELSGADIDRKSLVISGPWAIMRLFDSGSRRQLQPEKFETTLMIHGHRVVLEITANSVNNPFYLAELANFSCPARR